MDFVSVFYQIWKEFIKYCEINHCTTRPPFAWSAKTTCDLLQQYPAGLTQSVLLTELESKWRLYLRRGENAGKLRQVLTSLQLSFSDVLLGNVTTVSEDSGRYVMRSADGGQVDLLLHEQFSDIIAFSKHEGVTLFVPTSTVDATAGAAGRVLRLTQANLLVSPPLPLMLLPSPIGVIEMNTEFRDDRQLLTGPLSSIHNDTVRQIIHIEKDSSVDVESIGNMMLGVFALVLSISETQDYLGKLINVYRVVKLQVPQVHCNSQGEGGTKSDFQFIYLILYDGQTGYGDLISIGEVIYLYRPILTANSEDPYLFGASKNGSQSHSAFAYQEVQRVASPLMADYGSEEISTHSSSLTSSASVFLSPLKITQKKSCASMHFLIGSISCLMGVKDSASILPHARLRKTSESLDFSDEGHVGTVSFRPSYSSVLQKYSLHVDEQGTIDASSSYFPIAFDDYVPGLIKVSTFARVLSLVLPSPEISLPCGIWLLAFAVSDTRGDISGMQTQTQLMFLKCRLEDISRAGRSSLQVGQIVLVSGLRVEQIQPLDVRGCEDLFKHIPEVVLQFQFSLQSSSATLERQLVVGSVVNSNSKTKDHGGFINISTLASLVTASGLFNPVTGFENLDVPSVGRERSRHSLIVMRCMISNSKILADTNQRHPTHQDMKRKRESADDANLETRQSYLLHEVILTPISSTSARNYSQGGFCTRNCLNGQVPHVHAVVVSKTLSLAPSVEIQTGNFTYSQGSEYIVSMSRIDDVFNFDLTGNVRPMGSIYRLESIAECRIDLHSKVVK